MAPRRTKNDYLKLTFQLQKFFRLAVVQNDLVTVKRLVKYHYSSITLDSLNEEGISAVHQCCVDGNLKMLSLLLKVGANINAVDREGWTCLHACAATGNLALIGYLIKKGANVMCRNKEGRLAIDLSNNFHASNRIADAMDEIGFKDLARSNRSKFYSNKEFQTHVNPVWRKMTDTRCGGPTSILKKCDSGDSTPTLRSSVSLSSSFSSSSTSSSDSEAETLSLALKRHNVQFTANTLFRNYVHENEHEKLRKLLQQTEITILNKLDRRGLSAIHWAAMNDFPECIEILVQFGADVDNTDPNGWTSLHAAAVTNSVRCVKKLLDFDANLYTITKAGQTVFDLTVNIEVLRLLKMHSARVNKRKKSLRSTQI